jgi:folylpolyglutamate synthase/dihydropteroate synthase
MAKSWEITGRLGELQLQWLREHYTEQQLAQALAALPKKGFPLNVAKRLQSAGGPEMPGQAQLLEKDPESLLNAAKAKDEALARIAALRKGLR